MAESTYPSKLLLFGEYIIIRGAAALAIPLPYYSGSWKVEVDHNKAKQQQGLLKEFGNYLKSNKSLTSQLFDFQAFEQALKKGMYFDSSIPTGYGLGSSGALCAAVYDHFYTDKIKGETNTERAQLKQLFSWMESFFHGSSSGIDPLVCYLQQGLLIKETHLNIVQTPSLKQYHFFLLNTKKSRSTSPLVQQFLTDCKDETYATAIDRGLLQVNEEAIQASLEGDEERLVSAFSKISAFQEKYFQKMIPKELCAAWQQGLQTEVYYLKLCGAGGGGFMLGLTDQKENCQQALSQWEVIFI